MAAASGVSPVGGFLGGSQAWKRLTIYIGTGRDSFGFMCFLCFHRYTLIRKTSLKDIVGWGRFS